MNKIIILRGMQVLMVLFAMFELYVAHVSPTRKDTIMFTVFSLLCMTTFLILRRRVNKLKVRNINC